MADATREVGFVITADEKDAVAGLGKVGNKSKAATKAVKKFGDKGKKALAAIKAAGAKVGRMFTGIGKALTSLKGLVAGFVAFMAARGLISFFSESIELAKVQQDAVLNLGSTLRDVGASDVAAASKDIQDFASSLQNVTTVGDETTIAAVNLGMRLGLTREQSKKATKQALDLAAATGKTLNESMMVTAKAAKGETGALGDLNIKIDATKSAAGRAAEATEKLNAQFGGAAEAKAKTFSGAVTQLGNTWGDLKEILGGVITENKTVRAIIITLNKALADMGSTLQGAQKDSQSLVGKGFALVLDGAKLLVKSLGFLGRVFKGLKIIGEGAMLALVKGFQLMRDVTMGFFRPLTLMIEKVGEFAGIDVAPLKDGLAGISEIGDDASAVLTSSINQGAQSMVNMQSNTDAAVAAIDRFQASVARTAKTISDKPLESTGEPPPISPTPEQIAKAKERRVAALKAEFALIDKHNADLDRIDAERAAFKEKLGAEVKAKRAEQQAAELAREQELTNIAVSGAERMGEAFGVFFAEMASGAVTAEKALANFASSMLNTVIAVIEQVIIAEAAKAAAGAASGMFSIPIIGPALAAGAAAAAFAFVKGLISLLPLEKGGEITGGVPGRDSVPALLMPGERVLTVKENKDFKRFMRSVVAGSSVSQATEAAPVLGMGGGGVVGRPAAAGAGFGGTSINVQFNSVVPSSMVERKRAFREVDKELARNRARSPFTGGSLGRG